jgi:hypothetical protein
MQQTHAFPRPPPGTGKTTVARLYAQLLSELGVLPTPKPPPPPQPPKQQLYVGYPYAPPPPQPAPPKAPPKDGPAVVETSGAKLTKADLQKALDGDLAEGGVLFIDEAYQLNPKTNPLGGREVGAGAGGRTERTVLPGCFSVLRQNAVAWRVCSGCR